MAFLTAGWLRRGSVLLLLACAARAAGASVPIPEPQAKAAFLHNLPLFVQWPPDAPDTPGTLVLGIASATPVATELQRVSGRVVNGRVMQVRELQRGEDARGCHIVYLPTLDAPAQALLHHLDGQPVLTVGDDERFVRAGGMVRVYLVGSRLRFDVDIGRTERGRLKVSSKMLTLARVMKDGHVIRD